MIQLFKDKKYWREMGLILLFGIAINIACFCMPMVAHCANLVSVLPYLPQSENTFYDETMINTVLETINDKYPNDDIFSQKYIISLGAEYNWYTYNDYVQVPTYRVYIIPNSDNIASTWSNGANFENFVMQDSNYWVELNVIPWTSYTVQPNNQNGFHYYCIKSTSSGVTSLRLFGAYSPVSISNSFYDIQVPNWNYPVYVNTAITTTDPQLTTGYILSYHTGEIYPGDYTDLPSLDEILNNISGTYTPHTNDNPPTYDNSFTDGQNISNAINGHSTNMNNAINNLGQNIQSFFNKLYEKLTDTGNKISQNIYNGFSTLMQNIKDFLSPKLDRIIELLTKLVNDDEQDVIETWENTQLYSDFDQMSQTVENGFGVWQDTSEPDSYKIAFHVEQIPLLHCDTVQYIDLGLFSPVIPYIRSIMWALLVYSVFYTVIDSLANYLNGGDE